MVTHYVATGVLDHAYYLTDHLGSIDTVTDQSGAVIERMSFDAWGKRRETDWVPIPNPAGYLSLVTTRGYTGHEELDPVGLVHMNGRVYDPEIGRFVSADPIIQFPFNLQNLNRYSYVLNNPLSFTDPEGLYTDPVTGVETTSGDSSSDTPPPPPPPPPDEDEYDYSSFYKSNSGSDASSGGTVVNNDAAAGRGGIATASDGSYTDRAQAQDDQSAEVQDGSPTLPASKATVEQSHVILGFSAVGTTPFGEVYYHTYVLLIGPQGERYMIRAGPSGPGDGLRAVSLEASGLASISDSGFGPLTVSYGADAEDVESQKETFKMESAGYIEMPFSEARQRLEQFGRAVDAAEIPYWPKSTNSNAFAFQAVTALGLDRPASPPFLVPGHNTILDVK